ncbi:hypothetical protein ABK040_014319 [Willaertia magna]
MEVALYRNNIKLFAQMINCLAKVGEDVAFDVKSDRLSLVLVNSSKSTFCRFTLYHSFFSKYLVITRAPKTFKLLLKNIVHIFKSANHLQQLLISVDYKNDKVIFDSIGLYEIRKIYRISYEQCEVMNPAHDLSTDFEFTVNYSYLSDLINHFSKLTGEITFLLGKRIVIHTSQQPQIPPPHLSQATQIINNGGGYIQYYIQMKTYCEKGQEENVQTSLAIDTVNLESFVIKGNDNNDNVGTNQTTSGHHSGNNDQMEDEEGNGGNNNSSMMQDDDHQQVVQNREGQQQQNNTEEQQGQQQQGGSLRPTPPLSQSSTIQAESEMTFSFKDLKALVSFCEIVQYNLTFLMVKKRTGDPIIIKAISPHRDVEVMFLMATVDADNDASSSMNASNTTTTNLTSTPPRSKSNNASPITSNPSPIQGNQPMFDDSANFTTPNNSNKRTRNGGNNNNNSTFMLDSVNRNNNDSGVVGGGIMNELENAMLVAENEIDNMVFGGFPKPPSNASSKPGSNPYLLEDRVNNESVFLSFGMNAENERYIRTGVLESTSFASTSSNSSSLSNQNNNDSGIVQQQQQQQQQGLLSTPQHVARRNIASAASVSEEEEEEEEVVVGTPSQSPSPLKKKKYK